jgi:hypothetical protein
MSAISKFYRGSRMFGDQEDLEVNTKLKDKLELKKFQQNM